MRIQPVVIRRPRLEMVPLIDMFFNVLIFFIFGMFWMQMQQGMVVELPAAATAQPSKEEAITISLTASGELFLNQQPMTGEALSAHLQALRAARSDLLVRIHADRRVAHGFVMEVLDAVRHARFRRVSFETEPQTARPPVNHDDVNRP